jgi:hypothetical protein
MSVVLAMNAYTEGGCSECHAWLDPKEDPFLVPSMEMKKSNNGVYASCSGTPVFSMGATDEMRGIHMEEELFRYSLLLKLPATHTKALREQKKGA